SKLRAPFHLYVPASAIDSARRLATDHSIPVAEMWAYHAIGDQIRFTLVQRTDVPQPRAPRPAPEPAPRAAAPAPARVTAKAPSNGAARATTRAASDTKSRPARPTA